MRLTLLPAWTLACGGLLIGTGAAAQSASPGSAGQLQSILDGMMVAANAHDTDRFLAPYLHDSTLVMVFNGMVVVDRSHEHRRLRRHKCVAEAPRGVADRGRA